MKNNLPQIEITNDTFEVTINYSDIVIDKRKIGLAIGYSNGELPFHFEEMIDQVISRLSEKCNIQAGYRILELNSNSENREGVFIGAVYFKMDKIVTSQLKNEEKAAVFLCTIGPKMEIWSKALLKEGNSIMSYLVDIIASATVESIADLLHEHIGTEMEKSKWKITNRYSPGYCNWSVEEQQKLFSLLPPNFCDIKLTDTSLMIPIKSISGVIGLGPKAKYSEYLCDRCGIKDCTQRIYLQSKRKQQEKKIKSN